ncbi:zinc finger CCHC domain-containing protein 8-like [Argiope bruennichi]|uniref:zinc finger CCHC domain-containing protein 8-like n=1 Tax=Argiope bruennichi TaxID=94029 RepID=UPI002494762D|nr:zinc finger CCHC domain-containing protein 8-like [Argiope bruennichi]
MKDKDSRMENDWQNSIKDADNAIKVKTLTNEIQRLKMLISKITENMAWGNSVVKVVFRDEFYEEKYRSKLENFLKDILDRDEHFTMNSQIYDKGEQEFSKLQSTLEAERLNSSSSTDRKTADTVPLYSSAFEDVLHCDKPEPEEKNIEERVQTMTCFNCLGDHHMKDCPEKINRSKIAANRKDILMENSSRYHEEERKNSIKPGTISSEVRKALGLKDNQLPPYIYKMRVIGYPPGWMDDAKLETSGLSLYDEEGKAISDGESSEASEYEKKYDSKKFIEYPGFNCPLPPNVKDEWKSMGMVPIQAHQQLSEVLKAENTVNANNTNKRKNVNSAEEEEAKKVRNGTNDANVSFSQLPPENCSTPKKQDSHSFNTSNGTSIQKSLGTSISQSPGTPILPQGNRFKKLPELDKFAQGITEHLPFENLPDSVGKYEKMRDVLSNVQKKLQTLKKDS